MKILYTATVLSHICQFHLPHIKVLKDKGNEIHIAARDNLSEKNGLTLKYADKFHPVDFRRSPFDFNNLKAYKQLSALLKKEKFDFIICNTPVGGILTRLAARKSRKQGTKVIYIAHGFHFYKGAPKKNWLIYYPIEKVMAKLCDIVVTITKEDFVLAKSKFKTQVEYIHGVGVNAQKYTALTKEDIEAFKKQNGFQDKFVLLCTGELNNNKNQKNVIEAVSMLKQEIPELLLLIAGNGPCEAGLKQQIVSLGLEDRVKLLGYRTDLEYFTNSCDLVLSASFREGLPLNIMEAMVSGKPVIASNNRGHRELVFENKTGFMVKADDSYAFSQKIKLLYKDKKLRDDFSENAKKAVKPFIAENVNKEFMRILVNE